MARPRERDIDRRLLAATRDLLESGGYEALTMEAVAVAARVGKAALYRRYRSKAHLVFNATVADGTPFDLPDTGSVEDDLVSAVRTLRDSLTRWPRGALGDQIGQMIADPDFAAEVDRRQTGPALAHVHTLWERWVERGVLPAEVDGMAWLNDLAAIIEFRVLIRHETIDDQTLRALVRRWLAGAGVDSRTLSPEADRT